MCLSAYELAIFWLNNVAAQLTFQVGGESCGVRFIGTKLTWQK